MLDAIDHGGRRDLVQERCVEPGRRFGVDGVLADRDIGHLRDVMLKHQRHELVVDFLVPDEMGKRVDAGAREILGVVQIEDVCDHARVERVRLVDDRAIQRGAQLRHRAVAIVDPDLDEVDLVRDLFANRATRFLFGGDAIRRRLQFRRPGSGIGRRYAAAGREKQRAAQRAGSLLRANLRRQLSRLGTQRCDGGDARIGVAIELIDERLPGEVFRGEVQARPDIPDARARRSAPA